MSFLSGCLAGCAYALLLGPLFFAGVRSIMFRGLYAGIQIFLGSLLSDLVMALAGYWGSESIRPWLYDPFTRYVLNITGGLILAGFGISALATPPSGRLTKIKNFAQNRKSRGADLLTGFTINTVNPSNWLFWGGLSTAFLDRDAAVLALLGAVISVLFTNVVKIVVAQKIALQIQPRWLVVITRTAGVLFLVLGLYSLGMAFMPSD